MSSVETEYYVLSEIACYITYFHKLLKYMHLDDKGPTPLL